MNAKLDALLREVNAGAAEMQAGEERYRRAVLEIERSGVWRDRFGSFEQFAQTVLGVPAGVSAHSASMSLPKIRP